MISIWYVLLQTNKLTLYICVVKAEMLGKRHGNTCSVEVVIVASFSVVKNKRACGTSQQGNYMKSCMFRHLVQVLPHIKCSVKMCPVIVINIMFSCVLILNLPSLYP